MLGTSARWHVHDLKAPDLRPGGFHFSAVGHRPCRPSSGLRQLGRSVSGTAVGRDVLLINRRRYSPWLLLGLLPTVISAPWILR
jgi:hypothetical protein